MSKQVKVYGPGCKRCETLAQMVRDVAGERGLEVTVEKVSDYAAMAMAGVVSTPGLSVDGKLVHSGGLPEKAAISGWLQG